ncbi:MAG: SDR family oxidoreductase [Isosphaeraceae bacterium]
MAISIDLTDKIALITGASQGIGAEIANTLHEAGAVVMLNHPDTPDGKTHADASTIADALNARRPGSAQVIGADVSRLEAVQSMMKAVRDQFGPIDLLVNNAGILRDRTIAKMSPEDWRAVLEVNLSGVWYCCKYGLEIMKDGGSIVSISSLAADAGFAGQSNYAAAKAGVQAMMRVLSRECGKRGIRANSVAPGVVDSPMALSIAESVKAEMLQQIPLRRFARPRDVADAVLFLCSPLASYVSGLTVEVNGGWRG